MINDLVLHPRTRSVSEQFIAKPSHSLLIVGPAGAGKKTLAINLAAAVLGQTPAKLTTNPYFLHIAPDGSSITIETIRQTQAFVRLKTTGTQTWRRAIIIEDAHLLTIEAQNAFLKLLEEPPADTLIILTATSQTDLLPTITSRAPKLDVKPVAQADLTAHFEGQAEPTEIAKAYHMSGGQVGLMGALLDNENNQVLLGYVAAAKELLQAKPFERLVFIDQYIKQKDSVESLLWALLAVSKAALFQAGQHDKTALVKRWRASIDAILQAQDSLSAHPLPKLLLTDLSLVL